MHLLIQYAANSLVSQRYTMEKKIDEIKAYFNSRVPAGRYKQTTRSSLADIDETEYQLLYEFITSNIFYSKKIELLKQLLKHYQDRKSLNSPLPLIFRQAVYLLAYELCDGDYHNIAQKKALEDVGLAHNSFSKWKMHPKEDYILAQHYKNQLPLSMPIYYQGQKNYALVHLVDELSKQVHYKTFVDVFCGSGTVTLGIQKYLNRNYYMNDINDSRTNLINVLRDNGEEFLRYLSELMDRIRNFLDENVTDLNASFIPIFPEVSNWEIIALSVINRILSIRNKKETMPKKISDIDKVIPQKISIKDISVTDIEKYINITRIEKYIAESSKNVQVTFAEGLCVFFDKIIPDGSVTPLQRAIATVYNDTFSSRRKPSTNYLNAFYSTLPYWSKVIKEFQSFNITTLNEYDYLAVEKFNSKDTLLYMDSPYAGTVGYDDEGYTLDDFQKLCDTLKNFKGKWIFSCRATVVYKSKLEPEETEVVDNVDTYWSWIYEEDSEFDRKAAAIRAVIEMYRPLAPNVAFIRLAEDDDEFFFEKVSDPKEVMFFNFEATAPDIQEFYKRIHGKVPKSRYGCTGESVCRILSYEEFYPLARKCLAHFDGIK